MPLYEYQCQECGQPFEKMMRFSEASTSPVCPTCGSENTRKQISLFASSGSVSTSSGGGCSPSSGSPFR